MSLRRLKKAKFMIFLRIMIRVEFAKKIFEPSYQINLKNTKIIRFQAFIKTNNINN